MFTEPTFQTWQSEKAYCVTEYHGSSTILQRAGKLSSYFLFYKYMYMCAYDSILADLLRQYRQQLSSQQMTVSVYRSDQLHVFSWTGNSAAMFGDYARCETSIGVWVFPGLRRTS